MLLSRLGTDGIAITALAICVVVIVWVVRIILQCIKFGEVEVENLPPIVIGTKYVHRYNLDGTTDSICHYCLKTIATVRREVDLEKPEREHSCDPSQVLVRPKG